MDRDKNKTPNPMNIAEKTLIEDSRWLNRLPARETNIELSIVNNSMPPMGDIPEKIAKLAPEKLISDKVWT